MTGDYDHLTDQQLIELEQALYDDEVDGADNWFMRDKVLWEMNARGLCSSPPRAEGL